MSPFERRFGKYAIRNLSFVLVACYAIGYAIQLIDRSGMVTLYLNLNPYAILHGQIWRLVTWVLIPPNSGGLFVTLIMLYFYCSLGSSLEHTWGTYRYNVYLFQGMLFTIAGSFLLMNYQSMRLPGYRKGIRKAEKRKILQVRFWYMKTMKAERYSLAIG